MLYRFRPKLYLIILSLIGIAITAKLGFWQLARAKEKTQILADYHTNKVVRRFGEDQLPKSYQRLLVTGIYQSSKTLLLDNQFYQHQLGYQVLTPLTLPSKKVILVDRGWLPKKARLTLAIKPISQQVVGHAYYPSSKQWLLGKFTEISKEGAKVIEIIDIAKIEGLLGVKLYPFILRLDKTAKHGFIRDWQLVSMPPQRHYAYALQWFALSLLILVLFIVLNLRKKHDA